MTPLHRVGNSLLSLTASVLYGRVCRDVCTGLWGFRSDVLRAMPLQARGFELEAELFAVSARTGLRVGHVPVDYLPRQGDSHAKLSSGRDGLRIGWWLLRSRFAPLPTPPATAPAEPAFAAPLHPLPPFLPSAFPSLPPLAPLPASPSMTTPPAPMPAPPTDPLAPAAFARPAAPVAQDGSP